MSDRSESEQVELANVALREEMLRYNVITDSADKYALVRKLALCKVLVPVFPNTEDADEMPIFGTLYKHDKGVELYVYTSVTLIPDTCEAPVVVFYPIVDLIKDIITQGEITVLRVDPGTDHGVGFLFKNGQPAMFRLKRMEDMLQQQAREQE
ncbi:MAG: hypothetical protein ABIY71_08835 [Flavobacteriales bacterium]